MKPDSSHWASAEVPGRYTNALRVVVEVARTVGARIRAERAQPGGARGEGEHAAIDEEVEAELIRPRLLDAFPHWGYRGEETRPHVPPGDDAGHVWLVDPNDATAAYLRGYRGPTVSIGLLRDGLPVLGVLYAYTYPDNEGDLIAWAEGEPLTRNGALVERRAEDRPLQQHDTVLLSEAADANPLGNAKCAAPARFLAMPSIAYRLGLCAVGEGRAAVSLSGAGDWDYCAGHALLRAVGGELYGGDGQPVWYTRDGESRVARGWCFGGDPVVIQELISRPWATVFARPARTAAYVAPRPRSAFVASDSATLSRAQGCLLGQLAGDALGSLVEFQRVEAIRAAYPDGVRNMADGGTYRTLAGQPTDDSELALMLAYSIVDSGGYDPEAAAARYRDWFSSGPFDIGSTTRQALDARLEEGGAAGTLRHAADTVSQSNGSLMRCSPLAIWGHRLDSDTLARYAHQDSALTHPNRVCRDSVAAFCIAAARAIQGDDIEQTYTAALDWAGEHADPTVLVALRDAAQPGERQPRIDGGDQGWVLHALRNAFHQLLTAPSLEEGIVRTVSLGGDTDTNAAIAGALLGAHHGRPAVPDRWRRALLTCRPVQEFGAHRPRPQVFWPVDALFIAEALLVCGEQVTAAR